MKKKIIIVTALLLISVCGLSVVLSLTDTPEGKYTTMEERVKKEYDYTIAGMADDLQFNYLTMTKYADTIVIARTADHLTAENSVVTQEYREENRASYVKAFSSVRQVEVLETVKGDPDGLLVRQECAKLPTGSVLTYEGCYPMIKGDVYALFLSKQDGADNIGLPLSTDNGLLNLSYLKLNRRTDLAAMVAADLFGSDLSDELKAAYFKSRHPGNLVDEEILIPIFESNEYSWHTLAITTPYTIEGMELLLEYTTVDGVYFFRTNGFPGYYDGTW